MSDNFSKNRIIKNSLLLYFRMMFTMWFNLYSTRLVLANLGVEDMGTYGVVGSIVSMFTVFTSGITSAIQRFITFEQGKKDGKTNEVFVSSINIIFVLILLIFILLEIIGVWILNNKINIPITSRNSAFWVFQFSILNCIISMVSIPYNALIIANEKINAFAFISIIQVILSCTSAYLISLYNSSERLLDYALLMMVSTIIIQLLYQCYCRYNFKESKYRFSINKDIIKELGKFTGVSTLSGIFQMISNQGITFIINWTFGVSINAVYSIALQLKNSILSFSLNLLKAIAPQITKTYASGEIENHKKLVYGGSKMEIFMIYFIMIPFLFRTEYILKLWLGNVPEYTVQFVRCTVFISLTYAAFEPIRTAVLATNKIIKFMLIPDSFYILVLPISYFVSKAFYNPNYLIITIVLFDILACFLRVFLASKVSIINVKEILIKIINPSLIIGFFSAILCYFVSISLSQTLFGLFLLLIVNSLALLLFIYMFGLSKTERIFINLILLGHLKFIKYSKNQ